MAAINLDAVVPPTSTPAPPSDTATPTSGGLTPTAPPPTTTAAPACVGNCNGDGAVTVDELIIPVNIALQTAAPAACLQGVPAGTSVDIAMIIRAVNNLLGGCHP